jgi:hypothetical protein
MTKDLGVWAAIERLAAAGAVPTTELAMVTELFRDRAGAWVAPPPSTSWSIAA